MKRFVETERWFDPFFMELSLEAKAFYSYLCDRCDNAGVFERNDRIARTCLNADLNFDELLGELGDRVEKLPTGKLWITRFIRVQLNGKPLKPDKIPAHAQIIRFLNDAGIDLENPWLKGRIERQKVDGKKPEKKEVQGELMKVEEAVPFPPALDLREFHEAWELWLAYRRERKIAALKPTSIRQQFAELAVWGCERSIAAIKHSIRQNYQGIFEDKSNGKPNDNRKSNGRGFDSGASYAGAEQK